MIDNYVSFNSYDRRFGRETGVVVLFHPEQCPVSRYTVQEPITLDLHPQFSVVAYVAVS